MKITFITLFWVLLGIINAQEISNHKTCKFPIYSNSFMTEDMLDINKIIDYQYVRKYMGFDPDTMIREEQKHAMDNYKKVTTISIKPRFYYLCEAVALNHIKLLFYVQILDEWFSIQMIAIDSNSQVIYKINIDDELNDQSFIQSKITKNLDITRVNYIFINNNNTRIQTEFIKFNSSIKKFEVVKTETKDVPFFYYKFKKESLPEDPISMP